MQVDALGRTRSGSPVNWIRGETLKPSGGGWSAPVTNDSNLPTLRAKHLQSHPLAQLHVQLYV